MVSIKTERIEIEEDCWVKWVYEGEFKKGRIERIWKNKQFGKDNFWIKVPHEGYYHADTKQIFKVYPKISIKINPSRRNS